MADTLFAIGAEHVEMRASTSCKMVFRLQIDSVQKRCMFKPQLGNEVSRH